MLNSFKSSIDNLQLAPIELQRKNIPGAMIRQVVDHLFAMPEWLTLFLRTDLQALTSLGSDLLMQNGDPDHTLARASTPAVANNLDRNKNVADR